MKVKVEQFTEGKSDDRNEDSFGYNDHNFVIADGATDKSGRKYNDETGGEIVSELIVLKTLESELIGTELIKYLNREIYKLYKKLGITEDTKDPRYRFTATLVSVRIDKEKVAITVVGDSGFRINGINVYQSFKEVDEINAQKRSDYIRENSKGDDITDKLQLEARGHIMSLLVKQFEYQNDPDHELGYGAIDGSSTPDKFIQEFEFKRDDIKTIELFTDGYPVVPEEGITIKHWEDALQEANQDDPYRYKKYKSTKTKDDRTIAVISL